MNQRKGRLTPKLWRRTKTERKEEIMNEIFQQRMAFKNYTKFSSGVCQSIKSFEVFHVFLLFRITYFFHCIVRCSSEDYVERSELMSLTAKHTPRRIEIEKKKKYGKKKIETKANGSHEQHTTANWWYTRWPKMSRVSNENKKKKITARNVSSSFRSDRCKGNNYDFFPSFLSIFLYSRRFNQFSFVTLKGKI